MSRSKATRPVLIVEMDQDELACRIAEACMGVRRPIGASASDALASMAKKFPEEHAGFQRAAVAAMAYFKERSEAGRIPS